MRRLIGWGRVIGIFSREELHSGKVLPLSIYMSIFMPLPIKFYSFLHIFTHFLNKFLAILYLVPLLWMTHPPLHRFLSPTFFVDNALNHLQQNHFNFCHFHQMAVSGMSMCKPDEGSGDKKGSGWQTFSKPLKVQGHEGSFFKTWKKMNPTLCNCIIYTSINL